MTLLLPFFEPRDTAPDEAGRALIGESPWEAWQAHAVSHGVDTPVCGRPLLHWAAAKAWPEAVQWLLEKGASTQHADSDGCHVLFLTLSSLFMQQHRGTLDEEETARYSACVQHLLDAGAKPQQAWRTAGFVDVMSPEKIKPLLMALPAPTQHNLLGLNKVQHGRAPGVFLSLWKNDAELALTVWQGLEETVRSNLAASLPLQRGCQTVACVKALLRAGAPAATACPEGEDAVQRVEKTWVGGLLTDHRDNTEMIQALLGAGAYRLADPLYQWSLGAEITLGYPHLLPVLVQDGWRCAASDQTQALLREWWPDGENGRKKATVDGPRLTSGRYRQTPKMEFIDTLPWLSVLQMCDLGPRNENRRERHRNISTLFRHSAFAYWTRQGKQRRDALEQFIKAGVTPESAPHLVQDTPEPWLAAVAAAGWGLNIPDEQGFTPLTDAAMCLHPMPRISLLLKLGATAEQKDAQGRGVLHHLIDSRPTIYDWENHRESWRVLWENPELHQPDQQGDTPLRLFVKHFEPHEIPNGFMTAWLQTAKSACVGMGEGERAKKWDAYARQHPELSWTETWLLQRAIGDTVDERPKRARI